MAQPMTGLSRGGKLMHYSVGAIIRNGNREVLLVDRVKPPHGFACPAGHVDEGESPLEAIMREVGEEVKLKVTSAKPLFQEEINHDSICSRGVGIHHWYVYECETDGTPQSNPEENKSVGWYECHRLRELSIEPVWRYFLERQGLLY